MGGVGACRSPGVRGRAQIAVVRGRVRVRTHLSVSVSSGDSGHKTLVEKGREDHVLWEAKGPLRIHASRCGNVKEAAPGPGPERLS